MTSDGSGRSSRGSWASYDPGTRLWRTYQGSLFGGLEMFSGTWPKWGTMRNGVVYPLPPWVLPISESGSSLWRTPDASVVTGGAANAEDRKRQGHAIGLHDQVNTPSMWPTPAARDHKDTGVNTDYQKVAAKSKLAGVVVMREMWPTPRSQDAKHGAATEWEMTSDHRWATDSLHVHVAKKGDTGQLNPTWVEWLMGFPTGWTDLED